MTTNNEQSDLSQLKNPELQQCITTLGTQIQNVDNLLFLLNSPSAEETLNNADPAVKAQIDLFKTYAINSLFWVYLKTKGKDAANHAVKNELGRVREHLNRAKQLKDRAKAPRLNPGVAKRFVRSGLWEPKDKDNKDNSKSQPKYGKRKNHERF